MTEKNTKRNWLTIALFIVTGGIIYLNTLNVPFYFDDFSNLQNDTLQMENGSLEEISKVLSKGNINTRPISNLSFALNYYFSGYRVPGYHLVNIIIHITTAISLYFLIYFTLALPTNKKQYPSQQGIAFFASFLWLVHPVATQSVTYLVQRMTSMATMFYILSLLCFVIGRFRQKNSSHSSRIVPWVLFFLSFAMGVLSAGSKEIAITLPIAILLYEIYFFQDPSWEWLKKHILILLALFLLLVSISYIYLGPSLFSLLSTECPSRDFNVFERVFTQFRVIVHYMGLLLYPASNRLFLDYDFPLSVSMLHPISTLFSFLFIVFLLATSLIFAKRERLLSFCIIWFFLTLLLESSFICLELVFEHRTYLPATFFYLFFVALLFRTIKIKLLLSVILLSVSICFSIWTVQRNKLWQDPVYFWESIVKKFPENARANNNYGRALGELGEEEKAEEYFKSALELDPRDAHPYQNIGFLYDKKGNTKTAEIYYRKALKRDNDNYLTIQGLGNLLMREARYVEAVDLFTNAVKSKKGEKLFSAPLGKALLHAGILPDAFKTLLHAEKNAPENTDILIDLATAALQLKNIAFARQKFEKALTIHPELLVAHYNLALITLQQGFGYAALEHYRQATLLLTEKPPLYYNYANLLLSSGNLEEAEKNYLRVLDNVRVIADSYNNLGIIYAKKGDIKAAENSFRAAISIDPEFKNAKENLLLLHK